MKISNRLINNGIVYSCLFFFASVYFQQATAQTISPTNGTSNCSNCSPTDWSITSGTPDISNESMAAITGSVGGGATWVVSTTDNTPLVLDTPPNSHTNWLSLRDKGSSGDQESVATVLGGLVVGREYEVVIYALTVVTDQNGYRNPGNPTRYYAHEYNDVFNYQIGTGTVQSAGSLSINAWSPTNISFIATNITETLTLFSGSNATASGPNDDDLFETVQISVSLNAVNAVPLADDNSASTAGAAPVTFNVVSTDSDFDGSIDPSTVDLDTASPGTQNSITTSQGTWTVNASGDVTFTATMGFNGDATLTYTVMDNFTLDGNNQAATSNIATLTVSVTDAPSIEVSKTATIDDNDSSGTNNLGDTINYSISIQNTGNVDLTNIVLVDVLTDFDGGGLSLTSGPTFDSADPGSSATNVEVGDTVRFRATYTIQQNAVDTGGVNNAASVTADPPSGPSISDSTDAPIETIIPRDPAVEVTKTFTTNDTNLDGVLGVDDTVTYTIRVKNTGNVTLTGVDITDTLTNFDGGSRFLRTGPTFINSTLGSSAGTLKVGETARYTATYRIDQEDTDSGGLQNSVEAEAFGPSGTSVTDISDDDDDADGEVNEDFTITLIPQAPEIEVTKIASLVDNGDGINGIDDTITYTITIENTGNVFLSNITWTDEFQDLNNNPIDYTTGLTFVESDQGSPEGELKVGEIASYTATYTLTQSDVNAGGVSNSIVGFATSNLDVTVRDRSDDGIDTDSNVTNDRTITEIPPNPDFEVTKTLVITDDGDGETGVNDIISYNITLENTGNVDLTITNLVDTLTDAMNNFLDLTTGPTFLTGSAGSDASTLLVGEIATYTATFLIDQEAVDGGGVLNSVQVFAEGPDGGLISDISDDGDDLDGELESDKTELFIAEDPSIVVSKTANLTDNGDGVTGVDDVVTYTITIENTGNVTIDGIILTDTLENLSGEALTLTAGPSFVGTDMGSGVGSIVSGETATYTATYVVKQSDVNAGGINNTALFNGSSPSSTAVSDDDTAQTLVAQEPMIEATKIANITDNGDGVLGVGDVISYSILITNTGNVNLNNVTFTDTLEDFRGNARDLDTGPTFVDAGMGSVEGFLLVGETATYTATYVIEQRDVNVGGIRNQVFASADSPLGVTVTDISDDGNDLDGETENDPTETITPEFPSLEATKTFSLSDDDGDGIESAGDIITYTITVENTGNVMLSDVAITDTLTDLLGNPLTLNTGPTFVASDKDSPESILLVGETASYTATYVLTQDNIDAGGVSNTVLSEGTSPFGIEVEDRSDDGDDTDGETEDDPTETVVTEDPNIEATKVANVLDNGDGILGVGDVIEYNITLVNTGNVTLNTINLTDTLTNFNGDILTLTTGPTFQSADSGSSATLLLPGAASTFRATYIITSGDVNSGGISNTLVVDGMSILDTPVSDTSDDGDDTDGNVDDDPTETLFPNITITKTYSVTDNGDGILGPGDEIIYNIEVENTGLVEVSGISLTDTLTDFLEIPLSLDSGPTFIIASSGSPEGFLLPGETATYEASYTIIVEDVVAGGVKNSVTGIATGPEGGGASDVSDDGDDTDGELDEDETRTPIPEILGLETTKTASITDNGDGILGAGDEIEYTITIENTGNILLTDIGLSDTITDFNGNVLALTSGPTFTRTTLTGIEGILLPDEIATYMATYIITQSDVDSGGVSNSAVASGDSPLGGSTSDTSDDGDDSDGQLDDDPTETPIPVLTSLEVIKTASVFDDSDGIGVGDVITYTIEVTNTGNVTVNGITLSDTLSDFNGNVLTLANGPDFDPVNSDNVEGTLAPNEIATYTATYTITQDDVDAGGVSNTATASGASAGGTPVDDVSDDGDPNDTDGDGDGGNDPTETPIVELVMLELIKTASVFDDSDGIDDGDVITYTFTLQNTGNVTVNGIAIADELTDFNGGSLNLDNGPNFDPDASDNTEGTLAPGEMALYVATYTITQSDVDAGGISNTATASGTSSGGTPVDDVSDDGNPADTDGDGDGDNDPTDVLIPENLSIEATKIFTVTDADGILGAGDIINYEIKIENTGNVTVTVTELIDTLTNFAGDILDLDDALTLGTDTTILPGEAITYNAAYTITQADVDAGGVRNTVDVKGEGDGSGNDVIDTSDDGDDTDGNLDDDPTETPIPEDPRIEVTKTFDITNNGNTVLGAGDIINYTIAIENTGNVTLTITNITDTIQDFLRNGLSLDADPIFDRNSSGTTEGPIPPGETAYYTASYTITQSDVEAGGVSNSVYVEVATENDTPADDVSDDGDDTDGNVDDDPTETPIPEVESLEVTKIANVDDNGDGVIGVGDVITYEITIENNGNVDLTSLTFTDTFTDLLGETLAFDSDTDPEFIGNSLGSLEGDLLVDEVATYSATYTITQSDVDAGGVSNTVTASAVDEDNDEVEDISDDGDDTDGELDEDPTVTLTDSTYDLSVNKEVNILQPVIGENVIFTITLTNEGLVTANSITVSDILPSGYNFISATTTAGVYSELDGNWTIDTLAPGNIELLEITAEVLGIGDYLNTATITDTERGDDDDSSNDSDSANVDPICLTIYNEFSPNGDGVNDTFIIDCVERYADSKLEIYNRWGNIVYETVGYNNDWGGTSNGRAVVAQDKDLPVGTYYYVLDLKNGREPLTGWLYINR